MTAQASNGSLRTARYEPPPSDPAERWYGSPLPERWGISLVIPAYNEEERIGPTLTEYLPALRRLGRPFEILVICDGADRTPELVARMRAPEIDCRRYDRKLGKGGAVLEGFRGASQEVIGYVDADGSVGAEDFVRMLGYIEAGEAAVFGSRRLDPSSVVLPETHLRRFVGWVWLALVKVLHGVPVKDLQCGAKLFRRGVVEFLGREVVVTNWAFDISVLQHLIRHQVPIVELAVAYRHDPRTRFPLTKAIPVMFLFLVGIFLANHKIWRHLVPMTFFDSLNRVFSAT